MVDIHWTCENHFMMYVSQIITFIPLAYTELFVNYIF